MIRYKINVQQIQYNIKNQTKGRGVADSIQDECPWSICSNTTHNKYDTKMWLRRADSIQYKTIF